MKVHHTVVTGMTQLSGKTTTLQAIIDRSGLRAIAFKTKRGESGFSEYHEIPPFFKPKSDWQYIASILEAYLKERMKFERSWIIRISKGIKRDSLNPLKDAFNRVKELRNKSRKESLNESIYMQIEEYLSAILPQIEKFSFSKVLTLREGINVMDLTEMTLEMRSLVIRSVLEEAIEKMRDLIIVVPEAWEYIPQGRTTPVKLFAETFVRKGASINDFLFVDSQDIAGIDKTPLRGCDNWIMGKQKEDHEVDRVRELIGRRISSEEIRNLQLGHFIAYLGDQIKTVYVLPVGVPEEMGIQVALGQLKPEDVKDYLSRKGEDEEMYRQKYEELKGQIEEIVEQVKLESFHQNEETLLKLTQENERLKAKVQETETKAFNLEKTLEGLTKNLKVFDDLKKALIEMVPQGPQFKTQEPVSDQVIESVTLVQETPKITLVTERKKLEVNETDPLGKIISLWVRGDLGDEKFSSSTIYKLFQKYGWGQDPRTQAELLKLTRWGILEASRAGKRIDFRVKVSPEQAREKGLLNTIDNILP